MTRASHARIAARAAKFDPPDFVMPPVGMISEQIDLVPYRLVLGLVHPEAAPICVAVWNGERWSMLLPEQASQWADELVAAGQMVALAPVIDALRKLVRRVGEIVTEAIMRQETVH
jgi:hypothetical protein